MSNTIGPNNDFTGAEKIKGKKFKKAKKQQAAQIEDGNEKTKKKSHKKALILGGMTALALLGVGIKVAKGKGAVPTERVLTAAEENIKEFTKVASEATERSEKFAQEAKEVVASVQAKIDEITEVFKAGGVKDGKKIADIKVSESDGKRIMTELAKDGKTVFRQTTFATEKDLPLSIIETVDDTTNTYMFKKAGVLSHITEGERTIGGQRYKTKELHLNGDGKTLQTYRVGINEGSGGVMFDKEMTFAEKDKILRYAEDSKSVIKDGTTVTGSHYEVKYAPSGKVEKITADDAIVIEPGKSPGFGFKEQMEFNEEGIPTSYKTSNSEGEMERYVPKHDGGWRQKK